MVGFESYNEETALLEKEIERLGMALDIDWSDDAQVRALARLSRISTNTQKIEPTTAINRRFGIPRIFRFLSRGSIFENAMPATANMKQISMFRPIRSR